MAGCRSSKQTWRRSRCNCFGTAAPAALTREGNANRASTADARSAGSGEAQAQLASPPPWGVIFPVLPVTDADGGLRAVPSRSSFYCKQSSGATSPAATTLSLSLPIHPQSPHASPPPTHTHPARFPLSCLSDPSLLSSSLVAHSSTSLSPVPEELPYVGSILFDSFLLFNHCSSSLLAPSHGFWASLRSDGCSWTLLSSGCAAAD